jgi:hypothetical protein
LRSDRYRLIRIRARSVHILDDECNELMWISKIRSVYKDRYRVNRPK